jgi:ArsR family transcriptional regulator, arsenate/arsenite/antimonite-responsive transcriptional repressor
MERELETVDQLLKALADPTRLRIVGLLHHGEICVCHIHSSLRISQPKASRHLAYLRRAGVVEAEKRGLWVYYRLAAQASGLAQTLLDAARHCAGHLATGKRDAARLVAETGCCLDPLAAFDCGDCIQAAGAGGGEEIERPERCAGLVSPIQSSARPTKRRSQRR